ncbi:Tol-Pal system-associated acyl-CoA thioesterase [hydrothermal vent metagenome]|uniref:Tol-Pal system-associated acyl-CoA thioesterase n=1 Tax=hydrothermal vent metagenome TaxID=652676 RepID=A0A3B0XFL8_9ZZZZ
MSTKNKTIAKEFSWPVRVYYEDTDSGGVVYYANYLKFMERARTEFLRVLGFQQDQLQQELGIIFAVHSANIQYIKPARFNDELNVITSITSLGNASILFKQTAHLVSSHDNAHVNVIETVLAEADIKVACLKAETFKPKSIPASIKEKIQKEFHCGS